MADGLKALAEAVVDDDRQTARYVQALYDAAKKAKEPVVEKVKRFDALWRGTYWADRAPKHRTYAMSNFIFAIIETEVTWLTENRPNAIVVPLGPDDADSARIVEHILLDHLWPELDIRAKLKRMIRSALIRGKGFLKVGWDERASEVTVDYANWREIFIDPQANRVKDARYIIQARRMPISEIVRLYPEKGHLVFPDNESDLTDGGNWNADVDKPVITSGAMPIVDGDKYSATVLECWIRDDSYELHTEMGDDGEPRTVAQFLYPNGRLITVANGVVLEDRPNPYQDGEFPFVDYTCYEDEESPWDVSEVEQLEPIQRVVNILESRFIDNARLMTNTVWVKSKDAGISADKITNEEGAVYTVNSPNSLFQRLPPTPLPQHYFELYLQLQRNMEAVSGVSDVAQGRRPTGITAASAISLLQEASQARIRDKARNLEDTIRHLGRLMISRILQFYEPGRIARMRDANGQVQYVPFDPSQVIYGLDFEVESGSSIQMNEQQRYLMAKELFQAGGIDVEGLLEASHFPGREAIIERMKTNQAIMASQPGRGTPGASVAQGAMSPPPLPPGVTPPPANIPGVAGPASLPGIGGPNAF